LEKSNIRAAASTSATEQAFVVALAMTSAIVPQASAQTQTPTQTQPQQQQQNQQQTQTKDKSKGSANREAGDKAKGAAAGAAIGAVGGGNAAAGAVIGAGHSRRQDRRVASDLHKLLRAATIDPPYILVGQSFSGFNVRVFTKAHPSEVAGVVLLDSVQEDQHQYEPRSTLAPVNRLPSVVRSVLCRATPFAAKVGLIRVVMSASGPDTRVTSGFTPSEAAVLHGLESQPKAIVASSGCDAWEKSAAEAREAGNLGDVLLAVLTAGKPLTVGDPQVDREIQAFHEIWVHQLQPRLAALSTRGKQVIVEQSSHGIAGEMPSAALEVVTQILSETRGR
jgi:pimeloyl-ACP methyl ester carboxylesterase